MNTKKCLQKHLLNVGSLLNKKNLKLRQKILLSVVIVLNTLSKFSPNKFLKSPKAFITDETFLSGNLQVKEYRIFRSTMFKRTSSSERLPTIKSHSKCPNSLHGRSLFYRVPRYRVRVFSCVSEPSMKNFFYALSKAG